MKGRRGMYEILFDFVVEIRDNPGIRPTNLTSRERIMYTRTKEILGFLEKNGFIKIDKNERNERQKLYCTNKGQILARKYDSIKKVIKSFNAREEWWKIRKNDTAEGKLYGYYRDEAIKTVDSRLKAFRKLVAVFCDKLELTIIPNVHLCGVGRQNECITKKGGVPCGGGCYKSRPNPVIFIREMWGGYDTLLHELYHHVNACNDNKAIKEIMDSWHKQNFRVSRGYGKLLRKHGIPMKKRGWWKNDKR